MDRAGLAKECADQPGPTFFFLAIHCAKRLTDYCQAFWWMYTGSWRIFLTESRWRGVPQPSELRYDLADLLNQRTIS